MRGEFSLSHGGLKRARNRKRWIRPKKAYSSPGLLYSEPGLCAPFLTVIPVAAIVPPLCTAETGPGSQAWLEDTFAALSGESSVAIGNVGVAAQDVLEPIFLSLHVVAIGRARDVGLQPYGQRQPVPRQPAKAVAFVGTRSGLLNVDSLLYRSVGSGACARGLRAPLARLVWSRACDGKCHGDYWSRPFLVALFIKQAAQNSEASVFSATPSAKRHGGAFVRPRCRGLSSLPS